MHAFRIHTGRVAPLYRANIDTDQIIPKQFLKRVERSGFGEFLFYDWRNCEGTSKLFTLDEPAYAGSSILLAGKNFGCGSSREHAVWALADFGFRAVIAPSFADIFANNAAKNGLLTVVIPESVVKYLVSAASGDPGYEITIDLEKCSVSDQHGFCANFSIDEFTRYCLLNGLDEIGLTLQHEKAIREYESQRVGVWNLPLRSQ